MSIEIQIKGLRKKYTNGAEALKGIDLEIKKGEFFTLLGPNGAGKSTLINILTTLINKDSGDFTIGGIHPHNGYAFIHRYIGVASQDNELDLTETPESLLRFQGQLFGMSKKEAKKRSDELIRLFNLENECDKKTAALSGGNKRRLHCALALVHRPMVLFLDEPTTGMDPLARSTFWKVISTLNQAKNVTVFLTTQYLEEADQMASTMAMIVDGTIRFQGLVTDFKKMVHPDESVSLEKSYLTYIESLSNPQKSNHHEYSH